MSVEQKINLFAEENNLIVGICNANKMIELKEILLKKEIPFVEKNIEKRIDPKLTLNDAKSIIVLGMGYGKYIDFKNDKELRGNISLGAIGIDYHIKLNEYLKKLALILEKYLDAKCKYFVDKGPLVEREIARKSGLGWMGKNGSIISDKFGSYFFIGYIITNIDLKSNKEYKIGYSRCGKCNKCVLYCPGNALIGNGRCEYTRCISYITQKKGNLSDNEMNLMGNSIYGCDICQQVCPYNRNVYVDNIEEIEIKKPKLKEFLELDKKNFKEKYGNTAMFWIGINVLKRNALISVGNSKRKDAIDILEQYLDSKSEVIKYVANTYYKKLKINVV